MDVVSRADLYTFGISRRRLRTMLLHGSWVAIRRAVYLEAGVDSVRRRLAGAQVALGDLWVASHGTAALVHGLVLLRPPAADRLVLTSPPRIRSHADLPGIHRHRAALPADHVTIVDGVLVTTIARTLVDMCRALSLRDGLVAVDAALHSGQVSVEELLEVAARCAGWPWIRRARQVVALADPRCESPLESVSRLVMFQHAVPMPQTQITLLSHGRFLARPDFWWVAQRLAGEADGLLKYTDPEVLRAEKLRQEAVEETGVRMVRWTWRDVDRPAPARALAARLCRLLAA